MSDEVIEQVRSMAEGYSELAKTRFELNLDFSVQSLSDLDAYVQAVFPNGCHLGTTRASIATYVGEVICRNLGGTWHVSQDDEPPVVLVGNFQANIFGWATRVLGSDRNGQTFASKFESLAQLVSQSSSQN